MVHGWHAGLNNAFLITTRHEFARVYNDNSVLENRHVSLLYTLLANEPHADIFSDLEDAKWRDMRKLIINCIIHTDMVHHFPMVSKVMKWPPCGIVRIACSTFQPSAALACPSEV